MAALAWFTLGVAGCGADGIDGPPSPPRTSCPRVDTYLGPLYTLVETGQLNTLRRAIGEELPEDARRDLVDTILRLVRDFEPGLFSALIEAVDKKASDAPDGSAGIQETLGRLLRWLTQESPGAPYVDVVTMLRGTLNSCEGPPILGVVRDVLADEGLLRAVVDVLGSDALSGALESVSFEGEGGREALRLLLRNLLVAASGPDFDVRSLLDLLGYIVDTTAGPWPALTDGLTRLLAPGPGLDAVQGLLVCVLDVDPDVALGGLVYDLLTSNDLGLSTLIGVLPPAGQPVLEPAISDALRAALAFFMGDASARRSIVTVGTELLRPDVATGVLADVGVLLEASVLDDVIRAIGALSFDACEP
ncbi:MAG: hypothetical protein ACI9MR_002961 [Myxococcota bacterium]|jgi:hypothetical protein